jgi:hypothetical protein
MWRLALAEPGATLWRLLARQVLPPMTHALADAVESGAESAQTRRTSTKPDFHA